MNNFCYQRQIHFADTDSAGVVYFANLLSICHEAYESFLAIELQINLATFFRDSTTAIPIVHADIDFLQPLFCGDEIAITLEFNLLNEKVFEISYQITKQETIVAKALTRHICIDPKIRQTKSLPKLFLTIQNSTEK